MTILVTGRPLVGGGPALHSFETVRQCEGPVLAPPASGAGLRSLLCAAEVPCLETGTIEAGARCLRCARLLNLVPSPDRRYITVRCLWTDRDLVASLMIPAARLPTVPRDARAGDAARLAADYDQQVLLMVDQGVLAGVIARGVLEWADHDRQVGELARRQCWIVRPDATLGDALAMVVDEHADFILVVDDGALLGMLTRAQLLELADPPEESR